MTEERDSRFEALEAMLREQQARIVDLEAAQARQSNRSEQRPKGRNRMSRRGMLKLAAAGVAGAGAAAFGAKSAEAASDAEFYAYGNQLGHSGYIAGFHTDAEGNSGLQRGASVAGTVYGSYGQSAAGIAMVALAGGAPDPTGGPIGIWADGGSGIGVSAQSTGNIAVGGFSQSSFGVYADSQSGGALAAIAHSTASSAVQADNLADGPAILARSRAQSGPGGPGAGIAIQGISGSNTGVQGTSTSGFGINGISSSNYAVLGNNSGSHGLGGYTTNGYGFVGQSTNNVGMRGSSINSYGAVISGGLAPIRMFPSATVTGPPPTSGHLAGELFVDKNNALYYFNGTVWKQIA